VVLVLVVLEVVSLLVLLAMVALGLPGLGLPQAVTVAVASLWFAAVGLGITAWPVTEGTPGPAAAAAVPQGVAGGPAGRAS
jgi:hypothetical protein